MEKLIKLVKEASTDFIEWDWTMEFGGECGDSYGAFIGTPGEEEAKEYNGSVLDAVKTCEENAEKIIKHLKKNEIEEALELAEENVSEEITFGDANAWRPVQNAIASELDNN